MHDERAELHHEIHGEGAPLLWVHGFMGAGPDWRHVFHEPPAGFRLIAPDLRGHGSSPDLSTGFSFRQAGLDLIALLDRLSIDRACGIGISGGGIALLHAAVAAPARIGSMVLVSVPPRFPDQARAIQRQYAPAMLSPIEMEMLRARHRRGEGQIARLFDGARAMADDYDDVNFTREALSRVESRSLIVFGDRDPLYPVSTAVELYDAMPRASLWVIPEAGHVPVFRGHAAPFAAAALGFLSCALTGA